MAERQVADHDLLRLRGVCEAHVTAGGERSPCNLRGGREEVFYVGAVTWRHAFHAITKLIKLGRAG